MNIIKTYFEEIKLNFNRGMISFIIQRTTGAFLVFYLVMHIFSISQTLKDEAGTAFNKLMEIYNQPLFHIGEYLILLAVMAHLLNGLVITIDDLFLKTRGHKFLVYTALTIFVAVALVTLPIFIPEVLALFAAAIN